MLTNKLTHEMAGCSCWCSRRIYTGSCDRLSTAGLRAGLDDAITPDTPTCSSRSRCAHDRASNGISGFWRNEVPLLLTSTAKDCDYVVIGAGLTTPGNGVAEITARVT